MADLHNAAGVTGVQTPPQKIVDPQWSINVLDPSNNSYAWAIFVNIIDTVWLVPW